MKLYAFTTLLFTFFFSLVQMSCKQANEPPSDPPIGLTAVDASCTEAWLKVRSTQFPATVRLLRDGERATDLRLLTSDSLIIDEGLLPNRTYTYHLQRLAGDSSVTATSTGVPVTTMDTTSHDFVFRIDTLGVTASVLYDVVIISENNIWAVGELFLNDTSGQLDPILYNAAHWDGTRWNVIRIPYIYQGQTFYGALRAVFAFNSDDIWFGSGNMIHWNGQSFTSVELPTGVWGPYLMNKVWGHDGEIYVVGNSGAIAHRSATGTWRRLESGTALPIKDIYGKRNSRTGEYEILCVAADPNIPGQSKVLAIENMSIRTLATDQMWEPWGIWFVPQRWYIHAGDGLWEAYRVNGPWVRNTQLPAQFKESIRGQSLNDIMVCGSFWLLGHYNGVNWRTYFTRVSGSLGGVDIKGDFTIAVGFVGARAIAIRGRR